MYVHIYIYIYTYCLYVYVYTYIYISFIYIYIYNYLTIMLDPGRRAGRGRGTRGRGRRAPRLLSSIIILYFEIIIAHFKRPPINVSNKINYKNITIKRRQENTFVFRK